MMQLTQRFYIKRGQWGNLTEWVKNNNAVLSKNTPSGWTFRGIHGCRRLNHQDIIEVRYDIEGYRSFDELPNFEGVELFKALDSLRTFIDTSQGVDTKVLHEVGTLGASKSSGGRGSSSRSSRRSR